MLRPRANQGRSRGLPRVPGFRVVALVVGLTLLGRSPALAADLEEGQSLFRTGQYEACAKLAADELRRTFRSEPWSQLQVRSELALGHDDIAAEAIHDAIRNHPWSLTLRLLGYEVYQTIGRDAEADDALDEVEAMVATSPRRFTSAEDWVALGRFFLIKDADARKVLEQFFDVASDRDPQLLDAHFARAELALSKQDGALAAETLQKAPKEAAEDPHYHYLLARAYSDSDRARSASAIDAALAINPNHADSLLLRADHLIDSERHDEAADLLEKVLAINPREPRAWAYRAVLAHLDHDANGEAEARRTALERRAINPEVDHLIGRKLSQKYRFAEGSAYQQRALEMDPTDRPAKLQLAQDWLRLGREDEGWQLSEEVFEADGYNVVAFNLMQLRDHLARFTTLQGEGFVVRMDPREAELYGDRVLDLLEHARDTLCKRYGTPIDGEVTVEIFPQKADFAVRTFGLPGADGLLGVCFGRVVTAISPAAQGESPSSWESVLWHEFCHAVTLEKTRNTMPRWLSEGISVYEEQRQDLAWATPMTPHHRERILDGDLTPLSRLSSAFLGAKSGLDVQFAYFESALAVEFLVETAGLDALNGLLDDLGDGESMEDSLPERTGMSLDELDEDFARFARSRAESLAPEATWEDIELPPDARSADLAAWVAEHPKNFPALRGLGAVLVEEEKWDEAEEVLKRVRELYPEYVGPDNPYMLLAKVYQHRGDTDAERQALEALLARDAGESEALLRLLELDEAASDWESMARDARRLLGVNPLIPAPHRRLAEAAERLGHREEAIAAYQDLSLLDDTDPAGLHYHLATLLRDVGRADEARREVLQALEEAPRFRDAHSLLLDLVEHEGGPPPAKPEDSTP